jgi:hypothetical protein
MMIAGRGSVSSGARIALAAWRRRPQDPFGHRWNVAEHVRDVPHDEVVAAAALLFA